MEEPLNLAATFLEHVPVRLAVPNDATKLEGLLRRVWETGRRPWPQVALPADVFIRHVARRLSPLSVEHPLAQLLDQLVLADLYLACACLHQMHAAIATLESHYLAKLPASLRNLKLSATRLDEVCQKVRIHLLLGTTEAGPQIAEYTGRGALLSWMRVIAVRMAITEVILVRETGEENVLAALEAMPAPGPDPEFALLKRRYHREFSRAVREAFAAVSSEQRRLLRLHFIDRLSTTGMGTLFGVNQSTVSRWIKSARQAVYEETKRRLQERLGLTSREFSSLLALIDSQLDLNISQVLKKEEGGGPPRDE